MPACTIKRSAPGLNDSNSAGFVVEENGPSAGTRYKTLYQLLNLPPENYALL
jgi:hypothetical protein